MSSSLVLQVTSVKFLSLAVGYFAAFFWISPSYSYPAEQNQASDQPLFEKLSPQENALWEAKSRKEHAEAMARLPLFDEERLRFLLQTLREIKYPISFKTLCDKLGGPDSLVWCCTRNSGGKQTDTFSIAANALEYELIVDYDDSAIQRPPVIVGRARLCYNSPFGWRFIAESMDDLLQVGTPEKKLNQTSDSKSIPTPVSHP